MGTATSQRYVAVHYLSLLIRHFCDEEYRTAFLEKGGSQFTRSRSLFMFVLPYVGRRSGERMQQIMGGRTYPNP
jgi:hypothetical protein